MNAERLHQLTKVSGDLVPTGNVPLDSIEHAAKSALLRRRLTVGTASGVLAVGSIVGIATVAHVHHAGTDVASERLGSLTSAEYSEAVLSAQIEINEQRAGITAANATIMHDPVEGNLASCPTPSLRVQLIGSFPHILTDAAPTSPNGDTEDVSPTSLLITIDPQSGEVCQVGVSTGVPHVYPDIANLLPDLGPPGTAPSRPAS
jgi:hypothetical protein